MAQVESTHKEGAGLLLKTPKFPTDQGRYRAIFPMPKPLQKNRRNEIRDRISATADIVTVDVFDTFLLRKPIAERRRVFEISKRIHTRLSELGHERPVSYIHWTRQTVHEALFRQRINGLSEPEVRLPDIIGLQRELLALPHEIDDAVFEDAECDVEAHSLKLDESRANELTDLSRRHRVFAISDTTWSVQFLQNLFDRHECRIPFTRVYSSADSGKTKRDGTIFDMVAQKEGFDLGKCVHVGDDFHADIRAAKESGVAETIHLPRSTTHHVRRKLNGLLFLSSHRMGGSQSTTPVANREEFDSAIMGPIVADICLRLWIHLRHLEMRKSTAALFCARGGLVLGGLFERFLQSSKLPLALPRKQLMISRLVAARAALAEGRPSVFDEMAREYRGATFDEALISFTGQPVDLETAGAAPFDAVQFRALMSTADGQRIRGAIADQNDLFTEHLRDCSGGAEQMVLIDTGLYGSTQRLLEDAFPEQSFRSLLIARANYKNLPTPHFPRTVGLLSEQDTYTRSYPASVALRYWHLIEDVFEPPLASVREFHRSGTGAIVSNLEVPGWQDEILAKPHLAGVIGYIEALDQETIWSVPRDAERAWRRLQQMIIFPSMRDVEMLDTGLRSKDFGKEGSVSAIAKKVPGVVATVKAVMNARWKEGSIAVHAGRLRLVPQIGLEAAYTLRSARALLKK